MKNKFLLLAGTVLVLTLGSCVINYDTDDPSDEDATYSISGTVGVSDQSLTIRPAGTHVKLRQDGRVVQFVETVLGEDGRYTLNNVAPGKYTLELTKAGYATGTIPEFTVSNADVTGKDIILKKVAVPIVSYTVSGTISLDGGGSAQGADVVLLDAKGNEKSFTLAGADGLYSISGVTAGTYTVEAYLDGYTIGTTSTFTVSGNVTGQKITLSKDSDPAYSVHGVVSLSDGASPEGVHVHLKNNDHEVVQSTHAGANGAYTFTGVKPGEYIIEVSFAGYTTYTTDTFTVSSANVTVVDIDLEEKAATPASGTYTVSGTISVSDSGSGGSPKGAYVQLQKDGVAVGSPEEVGANGLYSISEVVAGGGPYTIEASLDGYTPSISTSFTVSGPVTGQNLTLAKIAAAEVTYTVSGTISLRGHDGSITPGAEARVRLLKDGEYMHATSVGADADGYYSISNVVAGGGPYTIGARLDGYETNQTASFTVAGNVSGKNLTLQKEAEPTYSISGTISVSDSASGGSPEGAEVLLMQNGVAADVSAAYAGADGLYSISGVKAGTYSIEVNHTGYDTSPLSGVVVAGANVTGQNISLTKTVIAVTGVSLSQTTLTLTSGETTTLTAIITPSNATNTHVTWMSDTPSVASVSSGGVVTAGTAGTAKITVTTENGGKTASCAVTVSAAGPVEITGKTIHQALDWIKNSGTANGNYLIKLGQDETNVAHYAIEDFPAGVNITIDGGTHSVGWTATKDSTFNGMLYLNQAVTLTLKNVTFTGSTATTVANDNRSLVRVHASGAVFNMEDGVTLTGNLSSQGGAVYVVRGGVFNMKGGEIINNLSSNYGHGVFLAPGAVMTMTGGAITGNNHRTNGAAGANDVYAGASSSSGNATLSISGNAKIGRIWLQFVKAGVYASIIINSPLTGSSPVATIDTSSTKFVDYAILTGTEVASSYNKFELGVYRSNFSSGSGTALTSYTIDSEGYFREK